MGNSPFKAVTMACVATTLIAGLVTTAPKARADDLTIERLHAAPGLSGPRVRGAAISPDGTIVTILKGRDDNPSLLDLWAYDATTGEGRMLVSADDLVGGAAQLSEEEKNRRERQRIYDNGIISYQWDAAGENILFPLGGDVFVYNLKSQTAVRTTETDSFETDPKLSPRGNYVSYVRDDEVYTYDLAKGRERQVTKGATSAKGGTIRNGVSEFVAQEELDRDTGYWWSPDDSRIAFTQIDEAPVPIAERVDINADEILTIRQRYPFAGSNNVSIRLGITPANKAKPVWVELGDYADIYIADVYWSKNGETLYVARLTRDQKRLDLLAVDPDSGDSRVLFSETSDTWVNLGAGLFPMSDGGFLWASERSGFQQLYRYGPDGDDLGAVTGGRGLVTSVNCIDEENGRIFYTGWHDTPVERHLYVKSLRGRDLARPLTQEARVALGAIWQGVWHTHPLFFE